VPEKSLGDGKTLIRFLSPPRERIKVRGNIGLDFNITLTLPSPLKGEGR